MPVPGRHALVAITRHPPFGGIEETIIELDGAAIAAAASRSAPYWPGAGQA